MYWKGGITGALKMAHLAEAFNMPLEVHHAASPIMNFANLHLCCAIKNCVYFEILVPEERYDFGLKSYPTIDADGLVHAPTGPGLGVEVDWDWIRAHRVEL